MAIVRIVRRALVAAALMIAGLALFGFPDGEGVAQAPSERVVAVLDIKGPIGPATSDYFTRSMEKARQMGASAIVVRMDTPGGLSSAMRDIIQDIITAPAPVITYVAPGGARAASAGTYILYASHVAAMAPGTNLGAATPIRLTPPVPGRGNPFGGKKDEDKKEGTSKKDEDEKGDADGEKKDEGETSEDDKGMEDVKGAAGRKAINDARAYIRSLAQMRGRNIEWAEKAVTEAASLSSEEALKQNVIDLVADNLNDLLTKVEGRVVKLSAGETTISTKGAVLREIEADWRVQLLAVITNPNIAYILLLAGIYGIMFEFYNPGVFVPGVVGAICMLLGLYALHVLPVNYAGLGLILLGIAFMVAEVMVPSFGVLGFGGIVALVIGSIILIDTDAPGFGISWAVIGSVVGVSALLSFTVFAMAAKAWRRPVVSGREGMIGAPGRVISWEGQEGRIRVHSEAWQARADRSFAPGDIVEVIAMEGLVLRVAPAAEEKGAGDGYSA